VADLPALDISRLLTQRFEMKAAIQALLIVGLLATCGSDSSAPEFRSVDAALASIAPSDEDWVGFEQTIAVCMAEAGFSYEPVVFVPPSNQIAPRRTIVTTGLDDAFLREHGYGLAGRAIALQEYFEAGGGGSPSEKLNPSVQTDYIAAYERCQRREQGRSGITEFARTATALVEATEEFDSRVLGSEAVVAATAAWTACMADFGHTFTFLDGPWMKVANDVDEVISSIDPLGEEPHSADGHTHGDGLTHSHSRSYSPSEAKAELENLRLVEITLASQDAGCRADSGVLVAVREVQLELESKFYADHADLLNQ